MNRENGVLAAQARAGRATLILGASRLDLSREERAR
jgi:hypothetical protein